MVELWAFYFRFQTVSFAPGWSPEIHWAAARGSFLYFTVI